MEETVKVIEISDTARGSGSMKLSAQIEGLHFDKILSSM